MSSLPARRLGVLTTALLTVGLLAPTAVSAAPTGSAATLGQRGSAFSDEGSMSTFATSPIEVRDLSDACPSGRVPSGGFNDVKGSLFSPAIDCLVWYEITQGKTTTSYAPGGSVTRQQMAVFLYRTLEYLGVADLVEPPSKSQFRDVPATGEAGRAINVLASDELADLLGVQIAAGKSATTFDPAGSVSRAQMGSFIARTLEGVARFNESTIHRGQCDGVFSDEATIASTHRANVKLLCSFGIVTGRSDGTYGPNLDVTRGQMAAFLMRLMDVLVEAGMSIPPDFFTEVYVDRGTGATACSNTGRDGTAGRPFCTIQAGIDAAKAKTGRWVDVLVEPRSVAYLEAIKLSSGSADGISLYGLDALDPVEVSGSIQISGDESSDYNDVWGFSVTSTTAAPAFEVTTSGQADIDGSIATGDTAIRVQQTGVTGIWDSFIDGGTTGVDLVATRLEDPVDGFGTYIYETEFAHASAFVRAPAARTVDGTNLSLWSSEFQSGNTFSSPPQQATIGGRRTITPIS